MLRVVIGEYVARSFDASFTLQVACKLALESSGQAELQGTVGNLVSLTIGYRFQVDRGTSTFVKCPVSSANQVRG